MQRGDWLLKRCRNIWSRSPWRAIWHPQGGWVGLEGSVGLLLSGRNGSRHEGVGQGGRRAGPGWRSVLAKSPTSTGHGHYQINAGVLINGGHSRVCVWGGGAWGGGGSPMLPIDFKNDNVPGRYFCNFHVDFKIAQCHLLNIKSKLCCVGNIFSHVDMLYVACPVDFQKWPCRPVVFKGQGR